MNADNETEDAEKLFGNLVFRVQDVQRTVKEYIDKKLQKSNVKVQGLIEKLEEEVASLKTKHDKLEELSQNEDHLQLVQVSESAKRYTFSYSKLFRNDLINVN